MTSVTSRLAYQKLIESGGLGKAQITVFAAFCEYGPMTGKELDARLRREGEMDQIHRRRISELRDMGLLVETNKRPCSVTGNLASEWSVAPKLPDRIEKKRKASRPKPAVMQRALRLIREWSDGDEDVQKLLEWLEG